MRRRLAIAALIPIAAAAALAGAVLLALLAATLPNVDDANARVQAILAEHGGTAAPLPANVGEAVVAVEDHRFYDHHGLDFISLLRAAATAIAGHGDGGGATITAQLAENLYAGQPNTPREAVDVVRATLALERRYTKDQILTMYLNAIYFGHGAWGVAQASHTYFQAPPSQLDWAQASLLAGLPQAPSAYDPLRHLDRAKARQAIVLQALARYGYITPAQATSAASEAVISSDSR